jgi:hypothetical protein
VGLFIVDAASCRVKFIVASYRVMLIDEIIRLGTKQQDAVARRSGKMPLLLKRLADSAEIMRKAVLQIDQVLPLPGVERNSIRLGFNLDRIE